MPLEEFVTDVRLVTHPKLQTAGAALFYSWSVLYGATAYGVINAPAWMQEQVRGGIAKAQLSGTIYTLISIGMFAFSTWLAIPVIKKYARRGTSAS